MRKQELIHLHSLLVEVWRYCHQEDDCAIDLSAYESLETPRLSIHNNKDAHQTAVFALTTAITDELQNEQTAMVSTPTD